MTDDERIADLGRWNRGERMLRPDLAHESMEFLLRVIRDQCAEFTQARQAIANMRNHIDAVAENHKQTIIAIEAQASVVQGNVEMMSDLRNHIDGK